MAEKTYKLSLQQLNDLVSDAVNTAIRKLDNLEIIDDKGTDEADHGFGGFCRKCPRQVSA